jgi:ABC-type cobalamin/Fe3+-siderophores transport system ATPase subunit
MSFDIKTYIIMTIWGCVASWLFHASEKKDSAGAMKQIVDLGIKTFGQKHKVGTLNGGNQQKVNVAKWLAVDSSIRARASFSSPLAWLRSSNRIVGESTTAGKTTRKRARRSATAYRSSRS